MTVKIDKTPPVLNLSSDPNTLWPPNHEMVDVLIGGSATDATSGISSVTFSVTDEYGTVQPSISDVLISERRNWSGWVKMTAVALIISSWWYILFGATFYQVAGDALMGGEYK